MSLDARRAAAERLKVQIATHAAQQEGPVWVVSVILVNGEVIAHEYRLPAQTSEALPVMKGILDKLTAAFDGKIGWFYLHNPRAVYNLQHVASVQFKAFESEEWDDLVNRASEAVGFRLPVTSRTDTDDAR